MVKKQKIWYNGYVKLRQSLFWDTDVKKIDLKKNAQYIIERVMDFGDVKEVKWMWNFYDKKVLKKVVVNPRRLRSISKNFWRLVLNIKKSKKENRPMTRYERDMEKMRKCF